MSERRGRIRTNSESDLGEDTEIRSLKSGHPHRLAGHTKDEQQQRYQSEQRRNRNLRKKPRKEQRNLPLKSKREPTTHTCMHYRDFLKEHIFGSAEGLRQWCGEHGVLFVIICCFFRGVGQVAFMDNPWTGLIMFIGLMYFNYYYALLGLIGGLTNYMTAVILLGKEYLLLSTPNYLNNGIFVYNGLLIGLMCGTFINGLNATSDDNGYVVFIKLIPCCMVFSYICTAIHVGMTNMYPTFPVFTFPFNFAGFLWLPISIQITWIYSTLRPYLAMDNADPDNPNPVQNVYNMDVDDVDWTV